MSARVTLVSLILALTLPGLACNRGSEGETSEGASTEETTSGGETSSTSTETAQPDGADSEGGLPTTTLIPVPLPGQPRSELSADLQEVWSLAERGTAMPRPAFEGELTTEAVGEWAQTEFSTWVGERYAVAREAGEAAGRIPRDTAEYGVAGGLVGYNYEEFVIAFRGAPVPEDIANDPELLEVYLGALRDQSLPLAQQAAAAYGACARTLAPLGPESPWVEWAQYCLNRAVDVNEVYELEGAAPVAPTDAEPVAALPRTPWL